MAAIRGLVDEIVCSAAAISNPSTNEIDKRQSSLNLRSAAYALVEATTDPRDWWSWFAYRLTENGAIRCLVNFGIVSAIPVDGSMKYRDLANQLSFDQDVLERLCKYAITFGFLREPAPGFVSHSKTSALVVDNLDPLEYLLNSTPAACTRIYEALLQNPKAEEPSVTGFSIANWDKDRPLESIWEHQAHDQWHQEGHSALMRFTAGSEEIGALGLEDSFDWSMLPSNATVVDVGGGRGHVMLQLAKSFPDINFVVQDRAELVHSLALGSTGNLVAPSGANIRFMIHDFFTTQPLGADVFFLRKILHDWSDKYAQKILAALLPAMKNGTRVLINEIVVLPSSGGASHAENAVRRMDVLMMAIVNGKERSLEQWKELVASIDSRLKYQAVRRMAPGAAMSLIEFRFED